MWIQLIGSSKGTAFLGNGQCRFRVIPTLDRKDVISKRVLIKNLKDLINKRDDGEIDVDDAGSYIDAYVWRHLDVICVGYSVFE